jgi:hypothetical protein
MLSHDLRVRKARVEIELAADDPPQTRRIEHRAGSDDRLRWEKLF